MKKNILVGRLNNMKDVVKSIPNNPLSKLENIGQRFADVTKAPMSKAPIPQTKMPQMTIDPRKTQPAQLQLPPMSSLQSTPAHQGSRFIGFQANGNIFDQLKMPLQSPQFQQAQVKPNFPLHSYEERNQANMQVQKENGINLLKQYKAVGDLVADTYKNGRMEDEEIARLYPEFKEKIGSARAVMTEVYDAIAEGGTPDFVGMKKRYPELFEGKKKEIPYANLKTQEQYRKQDEASKNIWEKMKNLNTELLSDNGRRFHALVGMMHNIPGQIRQQYQVPADISDTEITSYVVQHSPELKSAFDELTKIKLSRMDEALLGTLKEENDWLGKTANAVLNLRAGAIKGINRANQRFSENITQPVSEGSKMIEEDSNGLAKILTVPTKGILNTAQQGLQALDTNAQANAKLDYKDYSSAGEIVNDGINAIGSQGELAMMGMFPGATLAFNTLGETKTGAGILHNTVGLIPEGINNILQSTPGVKDWYDGLDEQGKAYVSNGLTMALLHKANSATKNTQFNAKMALGVVKDGLKNAVQRGRDATKFQAWVEKGLRNAETGQYQKGALGRTLKEGVKEFKGAVKENFGKFDEVLNARRQMAKTQTSQKGMPTKIKSDPLKSQIEKIKAGAEQLLGGIKTAKEQLKTTGTQLKQGMITGAEKLQTGTKHIIGGIKEKWNKKSDSKKFEKKTSLMEDFAGVKEDLKQRIQNNPYSEKYIKQMIEEIDRDGVATNKDEYINKHLEEKLQEIANGLEEQKQLIKHQGGEVYKQIRTTNVPIDLGDVAKKIDSLLAEKQISVQNGKLNFDQSAIIKAEDATALQRVYDRIVSGKIKNASDLLNLRKVASDLSKYDKGVSGDGVTLIRGMRKTIDEIAKEQIPGLKEADMHYADMIDAYEEMQEGIVYKEIAKRGQLRDNAINILKNLNNPNRVALSKRLEKYNPGLKAQIEAITLLPEVAKLYTSKSSISKWMENNVVQVVIAGGVSGLTGGIGGIAAAGATAGVGKLLQGLSKRVIKKMITKQSPKAIETMESILKKQAERKELTAGEKSQLKQLKQAIIEEGEAIKKSKLEEQSRKRIKNYLERDFGNALPYKKDAPRTFLPTTEKLVAGGGFVKREKSIIEINKRGNILGDTIARNAKQGIQKSEQVLGLKQKRTPSVSFEEGILKLSQGSLSANRTLSLGEPRGKLKEVLGKEDIVITQRTLKTKLKQHHLDFADIEGLDQAIENPLAIYEAGTLAKSIVVITDISKGNEKIAVAIGYNRKGWAEVNEIKSIHPKDANRLLNESNAGKINTLHFEDTKKLQAWLDSVVLKEQQPTTKTGRILNDNLLGLKSKGKGKKLLGLPDKSQQTKKSDFQPLSPLSLQNKEAVAEKYFKVREEIDAKYDKLYESKRQELMEEFTKLQNKTEQTPQDLKEIEKLANTINTLKSKYDTLAEKEFTSEHKDLIKEYRAWGDKMMEKVWNIMDQQLLKAKEGEKKNILGDTRIHKKKGAETKYQLAEPIKSESFKKWFGDWEKDPKNSSKVVDENGEPLVVYHGTNSDFTVFDDSFLGKGSGNKGFYGKGHYFTNDKGLAEWYSKGKNTMGVYLKIEKPLYWDKINTRAKANKLLEEIGLNKNDWLRDSEYGLKDIEFNEKAQNALKQAGYDGIIVRRPKPEGISDVRNLYGTRWYGDEYIVFEPNQIKSATDNIGSFDPSNPDIRYQKHGVANPLEKSITAERATQLENIRNGRSVQELADHYGIEIQIVDKITTPEGLKAYGKYGDGVITLAEKIKEGTAPHELFHATFDLVDSGRKESVLKSIMQEKKLTALDAEEFLADNFAEYFKTGRLIGEKVIGNVGRSLSSKVMQAVKAFYQKVKQWITGANKNKAQIKKLFDEILDGEIDRDMLGEILGNKKGAPATRPTERFNRETMQNAHTRIIHISDEKAKLSKRNLDDLAKVDSSPEDFFQGLKEVFGAKKKSAYMDRVIDGERYNLRIADHTATARNFAQSREYTNNTSIVIKIGEKRFKGDKRVDLVEYVYDKNDLDLTKKQGIIKGLKDWLYTGKYTDKGYNKVNTSIRASIENGEVKYQRAEQVNDFGFEAKKEEVKKSLRDYLINERGFDSKEAGKIASSVLKDANDAGSLESRLTYQVFFDQKETSKFLGGLNQEALAKTVMKKTQQAIAKSKNLVALHNLNLEKLEKVVDLGGLPAPSIAITKKGIPFENYGDITLVGSEHLVNPLVSKKTILGQTDLYTPRVPKYELHLRKDSYTKSRIKEIAKETGLNTYTVESFLENRNGNRDRLGREHPQLLEYVKEEKNLTVKKLFKGHTAMGNMRYADYTLENVVKEMFKDGDIGTESGFGGGFNEAMAKMSKKLKNLDQINRDNFSMRTADMDAKYNQLIDRYYEKAFEVLGRDDIRILNDLIDKPNHKIVSELREYGIDTTSAKINEVKAIVQEGLALPKDYIEAKLKRPVSVNEFQGVLVPEDQVAEVQKLLRGTALEEKIMPYKPTEGRGKSLEKMQKQYGNIFFAMGGVILPLAYLLAGGEEE